jgi:hypothetical protein
MVTDHDPQAFRIAFAWVRPGMVATRITILLRAAGADRTHADITYRYTGLSEAGNGLAASYTEEWFVEEMREWERALNAYLRKATAAAE